ncbi:MAG: carboxypeptidase-like regulatory domain-containing protein [Candidatus Diapherotrites archaeon]|nr:carboxypeptidase-like regulatory domain-containing protein [Candidatus Diapherotrites archaeon]
MPVKENLEDLSFTIGESYANLKEKIGFPPIIIIALAIVAIAAFFFFTQPAVSCGDGSCQAGESAASCPQDCTSLQKDVNAVFIFRDDLDRQIANLTVSIDAGKSPKDINTSPEGKISFLVPQNSSIKVSVKDPDYQAFQKTYSVGATAIKEIITLKLLKLPPEKRLIRFEDAQGGLIKGLLITATIECKDGRKFSVSDDNRSGLIEVELPENCSDIKVTADVPGYEAESTGSFSGDGTQVIVLKKIEKPKGAARFKITGTDGKALTGKDFTIVLEKDGDKIPASSQGYSIISFPELPTGTYNAAFIDSNGEYVLVDIAEFKNIVIEKGVTLEKTLVVSKTVKGTITVKVQDKGSGQAIANATVILSDQAGKTIDEKNTGENAGLAVFRLYDAGAYAVTAKKDGNVNEGYFPASADVNDLNVEITLSLQKITADLLGRAVVRVKDEDGIPVRDAKVMFRYKATGAIVPLSGETDYVLTDADGNAEFYLGPIEKEIFAYALKYPAQGGSAAGAKKIDPLALNEFDVQIVIGNSSLAIKTMDSSGAILPETYFEAFDQDNVSVTGGKVPITSGELTYSIKADKKIYLVFSKTGYLDYQTESFQLWPEETFPITAIMRRQGEILQPLAEFKGAFENGVKAESLRAGKTYELKFTLTFPNNSELSSAGFHFRAGEKQSLDEEQIYITKVNAPNSSSVVLGRTYTPPKGEAAEEPATDIAKWANAEWLAPSSGTYNVSIEVWVKEATYPNSKLAFYYRAWSVKDSNIMRTPYDAALGGNSSVAAKDGLYAEAFSQIFFEGSKPFCGKKFCIMGEWLYDKQEDIFREKPYSMLVLGDYNYIFTLVNNSKESYNELRFVLKNVNGDEEKQDLKVKSFIFYDANKAYSAQTIEDFTFSLANLGNFTYSKDINFNIAVSPRNIADTQFLVQVIGDKQVVFEEKTDFRITSKNEMVLEATPAEIAPFAEASLKVKAKAKDGGAAIAGALVKITRGAPDGLYQVFSKLTGSTGEATFKIPASVPLTKIKIEGEKTGFVPKKIEITVGKDTIGFAPKTLSSALQTTGKTEETLSVTFTNNSGTEFTIKSAALKGNFKGILNEEAVASYLDSWKNAKIGANSSQEMALLKTVLSINAEDYMKGNETLKGELEVSIWSQKFFAEYAVSIPVTITVSMGGLPDNAPCVNIEGVDVPEWDATTANNRASTEFDIYNVCTKSGQKTDVKNLQAMLEWAGDSKKAGIIELTIFNADGASVTEVLKAGEWITFWPEMGKDTFGSFHAILTFTPKTGYINETSKFNILFDAETATDKGMQKINNGKVKISASILALNLDDCISMPGAGEKVELAADKEEVTFELDATACKADVSVQLCTGDPYCKGGTQEGGIRLTPMEFTLKASSPKQTVTVYREDIPGLYGIPVKARLSNTSFRNVRTIDLLVEPETGEWFALNRYEALLSADTNWKDTVELKNSMLMEAVTVHTTECKSCKDTKKLPKECVLNKVMQTTVGQKSKIDDPALLVAGIAPAISAYSAVAASDISLTLLGLTCGPPCWGVAAAAAVIALFYWLSTQGAQCDIVSVSPIFDDYVVNLAGGDLKTLELFDVPFKAIQNTSNTSLVISDKEETIAIDLENDSKSASAIESYGVLKVSATEHIHGDVTHKKPEFSTTEPNFGPFNIPDSTGTYSQAFHLKFETKESVDFELPPLEDFYSCVDGSKIGITGKDARPRVKFNWGWAEGKGIAASDCDATNKNGVYCDATQFSIALSKRIKKIDEFLSANGYSLQCPPNPNTFLLSDYLVKTNKEKSTHAVSSNTVGLSAISQTLSSEADKATIIVSAENKTTQSQSVKIKITLARGDSYNESCEETKTAGANASEQMSCSFENLAESNIEPYFAVATIEEAAPGDKDDTQLAVGFLNTAATTDCWLPLSTKQIEGRASLLYFIDKTIPGVGELIKNNNINWPSGWQGSTEAEKIAYLRSLFEFKATLVKDGYGADFQSDFAAYYSGTTFFDVPSWFYSGSNNQLSDYFRDAERMKFKQKYANDAILPGPGVYEVYITIDFNSGNWSLYADGKPKGKITVEFYKVNEPVVNSAFYYLPFDGLVGLNTENGRQDYGLNYVNENEDIPVCSAPYDVRTTTSSASKALATMSTKKQQDLKQLNSSAATRGNVLAVEVQGSEPLLVFSPSYATPVILKATGEKGKALNAQFTFVEGGQPAIAGNNLSFWTGLGKCADFSGVPIREVFDSYADSRAGDKSYKLSWDAVAYSGTLYLYSIFYTPLEKAYSVTADSGCTFMSPDSGEIKTVEAKGITGMANNSKGNSDPIASVERILDMVGEGSVCVTNSGSKSSFWWNPKALKDFKGAKLGVTDFELSLLPGKTCIGPEE